MLESYVISVSEIFLSYAYNVIFSKVKFPSTVPSTKDEMFAAPSCECTRLMGLSLLNEFLSSSTTFSKSALMGKENGVGNYMLRFLLKILRKDDPLAFFVVAVKSTSSFWLFH